jgi:hypothetical protein
LPDDVLSLRVQRCVLHVAHLWPEEFPDLAVVQSQSSEAHMPESLVMWAFLFWIEDISDGGREVGSLES